MNRYEALVILPEDLGEEEVEKGLESLREEIKSLGGSSSKATRMGRKPFARPLNKRTSGEYALVHLTIDGDKLTPLHERLKFNDAIFRIQVTRVEELATPSPAPAAPAAGEEA